MAKMATFLVMIVFWVILSGMLDPFHLGLGLFSCLLVAFFSHKLLFFGGTPKLWIRGIVGITLYLPTLFWEIVLANLHVTYIALHPRMLDHIDPQVIRFRTKLKNGISKVTLAQSITLTPGTITVDVHDDEFVVYALTRRTAESCPGAMEDRICKIAEEPRR